MYIYSSCTFRLLMQLSRKLYSEFLKKSLLSITTKSESASSNSPSLTKCHLSLKNLVCLATCL